MSFKYRTKNDDIRELHFRLPKSLMYEDKYKKLSANAKLLYAMLSDRNNLSMINNWYDKFNRSFIICSIEEIEIFLNCARGSANKYLKELVDFNLVKKAKASEMEVEQVKNNTMDVESLKDSNSNILYVGYVNTSNETLDKHLDSHFKNLKQLKQKRKEKRKERKQMALFKNCTIIENTDIENRKCVKCSDSNDSTKFELTIVQNLDGSKTDFSKTDSVVVVNKEKYKKIPNRILTNFEKIQLNEILTTSEKIKEIKEIKDIDLKEIALLEKFIDSSIFISDAQLNMLKTLDYKIADLSLNTTISQGGETFSYFNKVYIQKEKEDIESFTDDFMPLSNIKIEEKNKIKNTDDFISSLDNENKTFDYKQQAYKRCKEFNWDTDSITVKLSYKDAIEYAKANNLDYPKLFSRKNINI